MKTHTAAALLGTALAMLLVGCTADHTGRGGTGTPIPSAPTPALPNPVASAESEEIVGAVIRFTAGDTRIDVTVGQDSPAVRDLASMLPMTLVFEDFAGNEKISTLPRELHHDGTAGSALGRGDFLYYVPWGNIGFWYSEGTAGHSADSLVLGTFDPDAADIEQLEGRDVYVELLP